MQLGSWDLGLGGWQVVRSAPNPWGQVPLTDGGRSLPGRARAFMDRLISLQDFPDTPSRRHHYVPRAYLREWSFDGKRIWALDTVTGLVKPLGLSNVCVKENFYRVAGPGGLPHNRVELLFGVVDSELRRLQKMFAALDQPDDLEFDDLVGLSVVMAVQKMRTLQERRLQTQYHEWLHAQNPQDFQSIDDDPENPNRAASIHTEAVFQVMWEAADVFTTRQIEIWTDPRGRFPTCDAPVLVPFKGNVRLSAELAPVILWPVSPLRVVALVNEPHGHKAVMRTATARQVGFVQQAIGQGRERFIFASEEQRRQLAEGKRFRRRTQIRLRCRNRTPQGERVPHPGCCTEMSYVYSYGPDVSLCNRGLHRPAPRMRDNV